MLVLPQALTHEQATACLDMLCSALAKEPAQVVEVDCSALTRFDSSALAVLLALRRTALHDMKTLRLIGVPERLVQLAQVYGVFELLSAPEPQPAEASAQPV